MERKLVLIVSDLKISPDKEFQTDTDETIKICKNDVTLASSFSAAHSPERRNP